MKKITHILSVILALTSLTGCQKNESTKLINNPAHFISVDTSVENVKLKVVSRNEEVYFAQEGD